MWGPSGAQGQEQGGGRSAALSESHCPHPPTSMQLFIEAWDRSWALKAVHGWGEMRGADSFMQSESCPALGVPSTLHPHSVALPGFSPPTLLQVPWTQVTASGALGFSVLSAFWGQGFSGCFCTRGPQRTDGGNAAGERSSEIPLDGHLVAGQAVV